LAVRFKCPISTYEFILSSAGIILDESANNDGTSDIEDQINEIEEELSETTSPSKPLNYSDLSNEELNARLQSAIDHEDYEEASKIKEEIDKRNSN
jgi:hypothetical protein